MSMLKATSQDDGLCEVDLTQYCSDNHTWVVSHLIVK